MWFADLLLVHIYCQNGESFMNYLEFYQQLSVLELLCETIDVTHCHQKSQHEEQKESRTENYPLTRTPQNKKQPEFDTSLLRLSSLQSLSLVSLWTRHLPRARLQVVKSNVNRPVTAFPTFRIDPLFCRTSLTKSWWGSPWKMIMSRTTAKKCKIYISTTITTIKIPFEMEVAPPHTLLTLSTMFTLLHSLHVYSLSVQGVKEVKGAQGSGRLRSFRSSRGVKCFDGSKGDQWV